MRKAKKRMGNGICLRGNEGKMKLFIARIKGFIKYRDLIGQLVSRDLKLKYRRSFLGYLWSVLNPLFIMVIMAIVFSTMFRHNIENYPVYLISGQLIFNYMNISTHQAIGSITGNAALLKKTYVPKYIFTVSKITSGLIDCLFSLGALVLVMLFTKARFSWHLILFPMVLLQCYVFNTGLGMLLAATNTFFRDIQYIYNAITTAWMYLTPMFYPLESLPETLRRGIIRFNPMYSYVTQMRCLTLYNVVPDWRFVALGSAYALLFLVIGTAAFARTQDRFILYI